MGHPVSKYDSVRQTQLNYLLITIKLATCFDPIGSSSGPQYEPINDKKTAYIFGIPIIFTKDEFKSFVSNGHEHFTFILL